MNIKEYISSGILESYALGELSDRERAEVERLLERHSELREELDKIERAQERLLFDSAISPAPRVKDNLLRRVQEAPTAVRVIPISWWKFAAAASVLFAAVCLYLAFDYRSKWIRSESNLSQLIAQNQQMAQNYNQVNDRVTRMEQDLSIMENPQFQRVVMTSTSSSAPDAMASVYWNSRSKELFLKIQNLKTLAHDQQYQLWAIIDGKPVDAGVFDMNPTGMIRMKEIGKGASTFAVTIEPRGGRPTPTMETMQVAGNVQKT